MTQNAYPTVHFLLVDDREPNLIALEALLARDGLIMHKAKSGNEALEVLLKHDIALALIDVQMPDMNGFELAELMRGAEKTRRVPIIFLTAATDDYQRRFRGYESGAVDYLTKPFEMDILKSKASVFFDLYCQRQEVARNRDELALMVTENERLLEESRTYALALQDTVRRKDEFLAMLAHELRNPLAPIKTGLDLLAMDGTNRETIVEMMQEQVKHVVRLVDDLLDASRIVLGKIELRKEPVELASLVRRAATAVQPVVDRNGQKLVVDVPDSGIWLNADPVRLTQVIGNLLTNAAKYTESGGLIELTVTSQGNEAEVRVRDTGVGIDQEMLPKVFDLFAQASCSLDRSQGGLGIGLTLVQRLVAMHDGRVSAHSEGLTHGSTFVVNIPTIDAPLPFETTSTVTEHSTDLRVLVVDDNKSATYLLSELLMKLNVIAVDTAHDGVVGFSKAKELRPDLVILDIGLPGMDGYQVGRAIRETPDLEDVFLVALTGYGQKEDREKSRLAGFDEHLVKPPSIDQLKQLLVHPKLFSRS